MLNQFYKYLSEKLIKFLDNNDIKAGERYYIQLDEKNQVEEFYEVLKAEEHTEKFIYKHDKGGVYETFSIKLKDVKLVVASTVNVTSGYLVTMRNASKDQLDVWNNTALLILCHETLDSIQGGCCDLRSDGMPLSVKSISNKLSSEIDNSGLSKADKEIVKFHIKQKLDDSYNASLWDYEEILSIINKKSIDSEEYKAIGLFEDKSLDTYTPKEIQKRLKENFDLYSKVESYQEYEDKEQYLEKYFDEKGVKALKDDEWRSVDFGKVKASVERNNANKALEYIESFNKNVSGENIIFWEKAKSDTASGRRKRHIIVFDTGELDELTLTFSFDDNLSKEFIESNSKKYVSTAGKKLIVKLPSNSTESGFYKLVYTHNNQSKSKYEFYIAVLNIEEKYLSNIKTLYEIKTGSGSKNRIQINNDGNEIKFGQGSNESIVEVESLDDIINVSEDEVIKISNSSPAWEDDLLKFRLNFEGAIIPIEIKEQSLRSKPITSVNLLKYKREYKESFIWEENKIKQGTNEYYLDEKLKVTLNREKEIVEKEILYGIEVLNEIEKVDVNYSDELINCYLDILNYYKRNNTVPSLTYLDNEIKEYYQKYLEVYNKEIEEIQAKDILSNKKNKKDLLKLGTIVGEGSIKFSPFSPINIAYILEVYKQLEDEVIETHILERLRPNNLLPYIYNSDNDVYKPVHQKQNMEWTVFENKEKVSIGETNAFVAKVVREKIEQFINNFSYLFPKNSSAPIKINVINIKNDKEVVRGVFEYIKKQIVSNAYNIIPVDIKIFNKEAVSAVDTFFELTSIDKLESEFNISFSTRNNQFDEVDVMRMVLENIKYYKSNTTDYDYAHISFYKCVDDDRVAEDNASNLESGVSIGGLMSAVTSNNNENDYRIGFGTKNIIEDNMLIRTAVNLNEFAVNCVNNSINPYRVDTSIVTRPLTLDMDIKNKLYSSSHWVTFIEPSFGLEYFKENDNNTLVVIHYSDQYSSTEQYDTITVTNKSNQYKYIIREFLSRKNIDITEEKLNEAIRSFNSINGEWLLNLIANKSEYDREKLSIISSLKYGLSILNHDDIIWIPISLEEVLRVSNAVRLNKSEGIFSVKNLNQKGVHSDDLIFIGVNIKDSNNLKVYYYPVEVKIGYNFSDVIDKGKIQVNKTYELLKEQLSQYTENGRKKFKNKFFRNFFIKILISNAQKLIINNVWNEKNIERLNLIKKLLLDDEYKVCFDLEQYIGKGALISFKKDNHWRSVRKEDGVLFIELTENDAYQGIAKPVNELYEEFKNGSNDIDICKVLYNKNIDLYIESKEIEDREEILVSVAQSSINENYNNIEQISLIGNEVCKEVNECEISETANVNNNIRVLLGEVEGSTKKIYWEYGNRELANRHMLITGKSGNGKTYFIQCALKELIEAGIPAIIIDYTDGFKSSQLEPEFKEYLGDRLKQFIVAANKFPLNLFKKGIKELDEDYNIDEDEVDVAERFKSVIGAVYKDLGPQQLNCIYQAVIRGLEKYDGNLNLRAFRNELEEDASSCAQTALSQLNLLIDKNPFQESEDFEWGDLHKDGSKLFIIQLTGYTKDVQKIITEMILWDLWNYKTQHGSKNKPFAVVLDESQNLNFGDSSPSTKILTEGRKFGWSAWFATQFLKGQFDKATISRLQNSAQKIYFAQTEEAASTVASGFAESVEDKKAWNNKLINLEKGSCIVQGPIEDSTGQLTFTKPVKIKITSLSERIK